jgi:eukaryotic-like serine/threonine-protein kinase
MNEETLFQEVLSRSPEERATFLDQACAGRPELRAAVEALLMAREKYDSLTDVPPTDLGQSLKSNPGQVWADAAVGPTESADATTPDTALIAAGRSKSEAGIVIAGRYTLEKKIGEGGMGVVWVAQQAEPVKRKVALKLIKTGMDSAAVLARFEQERQALAIMDHPHIARVLDGGLTPTGQPFFVMELVDGLPLTRFCDEAKLTTTERLQLFLPICQAVQHAHQKGIVHRDLKPANILVTRIDGKPFPRVIDFGVAKAISGKLTDESLSTQFGSIIGTLEYMSPEQAGISGVDVDTRADIYSLGVILYELLTGLRPIDAKRLKKAALIEMIRIIQEEEPSKPSTRLATDESLPSIAALRHTEPRKLMAILRGELDWVVMKCLERQRERRYETANGLARDIECYLADLPVEARPPSARYRFGKFLRRNKAAVMAASLVFLALLAGMAGTTFGLLRAEAQRAIAEKAEKAEGEQRAQAEIERDKAIASEAKSKAINEFLIQDLLTQAEPGNNAAEDHVTLLEVLDRAAEQVGTRFTAQPDVESALRDTIFRTYHGLASWEKAENQVRAMLEAARKRAPTSAQVYYIQSELAHILRHRKGPDAEVLKLAESAAEGLKRTAGAEHDDTMSALAILAQTYEDAGKRVEAIALFERVRDALAAKFGPDHRDTLIMTNNLASGYLSVGRHPEAIALLERVRDAQIVHLGPDHPDTLITISSLGAGYWRLKQLDKSVPLFEDLLKRRDARLGRQHRDTQATAADLGINYKDAGRLDLAIPLLEEVYRAGDTFPDLGWVGGPLLDAYAKTGRSADVAKMVPEYLAAVRKSAPSDSPQLADALVWCGSSLLQVKAYAAAEPLLRECLAIREQTQPNSRNAVAAQSMLGKALVGQKKYTEAEPLFLAAYQGRKQLEATNPPQGKSGLPEAVQSLIQLYEATSKPDEAARWRAELEATKGAEKLPEKKP